MVVSLVALPWTRAWWAHNLMPRMKKEISPWHPAISFPDPLESTNYSLGLVVNSASSESWSRLFRPISISMIQKPASVLRHATGGATKRPGGRL